MKGQQRRNPSKLGNGRDKSDRTSADLLRAAMLQRSLGQLRLAETSFLNVLKLDPTSSEANYQLGLIAIANGSFQSAVGWLMAAITIDDKKAEYFAELAVAFKGQGMLPEAIAGFDMALDIDPVNLKALRGRFDCAVSLRLYDTIFDRYDHATKLEPDNIELMRSYGDAHIVVDKHAAALTIFDKLLPLAQDQPWVHNARAGCFVGLGRHAAALPCAEVALSLDPQFDAAKNNKGLSLTGLRRLDEAKAVFSDLLQRHHNSPDVQNNMGNVCLALKEFETARDYFKRAIDLNADYRVAYSNLLVAYKELGQYDKALELEPIFDQKWPDYAEAHWNLSLVHLLKGDLPRGFAKAEARWHCHSLSLSRRDYAQPVWLGKEPLDGKSILLFNDQGLGDAMQFCRFVPLLAARGARVIVQIESSLNELMSTVEGVDQCTSFLEIDGFDYQCSLASLPLALETTLDTIPATVPYLKVPQRTSGRDFGLSPSRFKVGLVWSGNPNHANDLNRSMALSQLAPLLELDADFYVVQNAVRDSDLPFLEASRITNLGPELKTFADTAALVTQLDLVISVDTSVVHLTGALGCPVWVLLPLRPDWRWLLQGEGSPWYPTARIFRQDDSRAWAPVIERVKNLLSDLLPAHSAAQSAETIT